MTATLISRMSKTLKAEAVTAANMIDLDGYTVNGNTITDAEGGTYPIHFYRNGEEVIAVADFYIGEDACPVRGSKGNWYILNGETLEAE